MRLIDADALKEWVENVTESDWGWQEMLDRIDSAPTIDAVPVVRCKDCEHWQYDKLFNEGFCKGESREPDFFCSRGKRKEDNV